MSDEVRQIVISMMRQPLGCRGVPLQAAHDRFRPGAMTDKFIVADARVLHSACSDTMDAWKPQMVRVRGFQAPQRAADSSNPSRQ
jgi:hypothetical protein